MNLFPEMTITPHDYQEKAISDIMKYKEKGGLACLLVMATGLGKTIVFLELAKRLNARTLIIVHRDELLGQAIKKMQMVWREAEYGIVKAEVKEFDKQVTVASRQTLERESNLTLLPNDYDLVITDEAHHSIADSYRRIYEHIGAGDTTFHLGVTATPNRSDKKGLIDIYDEVVYEMNLIDGIVGGHLCNLKSEIIRAYDPFEDETESIHDILNKQKNPNKVGSHVLTKILELPEVIGRIINEWKRLAGDRQTIAFCPNVDHAYALANKFSEYGISAHGVSTYDKAPVRRQLIRDFLSEKFQVITNYDILTEGFDAPTTSCILIARPTDSDLVYTQMVGRGTRIAPNKDDCLILDVACISEARNLVSFPDLIGFVPKPDEGVLENVIENKRIRTGYAKELGLSEDIQIDDTRRGDPFAMSRFAWVQHESDYKIFTGFELGRIHLKQDKDNSGNYFILLEGEQFGDDSLPLDWAMTMAENYVNKHDRHNYAQRNNPWRQRKATPNQRRLIEKSGRVMTEKTRGEASDVIEIITWNWKPKKKEKKNGNTTEGMANLAQDKGKGSQKKKDQRSDGQQRLPY